MYNLSMINCDICGIPDSLAGNGGAAIREEDGTWTFSCEECLNCFCKLSESERKLEFATSDDIAPLPVIAVFPNGKYTDQEVRNHGRKVAYWLGVGTNQWSISLANYFDKSVAFDVQVLALKATEAYLGIRPISYSIYNIGEIFDITKLGQETTTVCLNFLFKKIPLSLRFLLGRCTVEISNNHEEKTDSKSRRWSVAGIILSRRWSGGQESYFHATIMLVMQECMQQDADSVRVLRNRDVLFHRMSVRL
jgi:hypothetical protein